MVRQIGYIKKNVQGNRIYSVDDVSATLASQTGGLGGAGVSLIIDNELSKNKGKEDEDLAKKEVKCVTCSVEFFSYNPNPKYCSKNCKDASLRHVVDFEEIVELYESGMTQHEVAIALGTTQKVIYSRMKENDYRPRVAYKRNQLGENNSYWRGGKSISTHGYVYIKSPGHPRANNSGDYVFEHILVAENVLGRFLTNEEVVHHINGMKTDNRVCNLYLTTKSDHTRMHNLGTSHDVVSNLLSGDDMLMKRFNFIDLFSGIGGFHTALKEIGGECVFASEIDKFAKQAYTTLHGLEPHGDITKIDAKDIPDHDVIAAGFPCQSFSVSGKRGGFEDARGTLFFEVARIASEKQPKVLLLENVKGLVGHDKGKTLDTIVKTLNEIGYRVDFEVLNSKYFGVPQNRERIFIVAIREDLISNEPWNIVGNTVAPKGKRRISGYEDVKTFNFDWPTNDTVELRLKDVLETDVEERFYLSEEKTAQLVLQLKEREDIGISEPTIADNTGVNLSKQATEVANVVEVSGTLMARDYKGFGNQEMTGVVERLPISVQKDNYVVEPLFRIRRLTPKECWRLQGFTDEQHDLVEQAGISNTQRYKQAGNAVTINVIRALGKELLKYVL